MAHLSHTKFWILLGIFCVSLGLHAFFAWHQPFTNDEGAYLYDARTMVRGEIPGGDVFTKTPGSVLLFAGSEFLTHDSLFAARAVNVLASLATSIPLFFFVRLISSKKTAWYAVYCWLLGSGPILFHTIGHTQALASLFSVMSLLFWVRGVQQKSVRNIVCAGIFFAIAFATRKTAISLVVPYGIIAFLYGEKKKMVRIVLAPFIVGLGGVFLFWIIGVSQVYGMQGVWQLLGGSYMGILSRNIVDHSSIVLWGGGTIQFFLTAVRTGTMYAIAYMFILGLLGMNIGKQLGSLYARCVWGILASVSLGAAMIMFSFTSLLGWVWVATGMCMISCALKLPRVVFLSKPLLILISYIATLGILYIFWPVLLTEYAADFIVPSTILCALVLGSFTPHAIFLRWVFLLVVCASALSMESVWQTPWTGMFTRQAVYESAQALKEHVPYTDPVFTAAVIIPYVSGHGVLLNIAHPQWYAYDFISSKDKDVFLPTPERVRDQVEHHVKWKIQEQLTDYSYPDFSVTSWKFLQTISNNTGYRDNPIGLYVHK